MLYRKDLEMFGMDNCVELITICLEKNLNVKLGDKAIGNKTIISKK